MGATKGKYRVGVNGRCKYGKEGGKYRIRDNDIRYIDRGGRKEIIDLGTAACVWEGKFIKSLCKYMA